MIGTLPRMLIQNAYQKPARISVIFFVASVYCPTNAGNDMILSGWKFFNSIIFFVLVAFFFVLDGLSSYFLFISRQMPATVSANDSELSVPGVPILFPLPPPP